MLSDVSFMSFPKACSGSYGTSELVFMCENPGFFLNALYVYLEALDGAVALLFT